MIGHTFKDLLKAWMLNLTQYDKQTNRKPLNTFN